MTHQRSQSDYRPVTSSYNSQQDEIRQDADLSALRGADSSLGHTYQITNLPNNGQNNGRLKRSIQDHPQWSAYLADRRILGPAIAARAWVEREDWAGQDVLVWPEKRRAGSAGATRLGLLKLVCVKGKKLAKVRWQFAGQKTDEPFHYIGTQDELKDVIAHNSGTVYIVEGHIDVWSMHTLGFPNTVGIYGSSNIPKEIASILHELNVTKTLYYADNDKAGEQGASKLRTLLHEAGWRGEEEYRKFAGPGIPEKGDANNLLCHHYPGLSAARAALDGLPRFQPSIKRKPAPIPAVEMADNGEGLDMVKEAVRLARIRSTKTKIRASAGIGTATAPARFAAPSTPNKSPSGWVSIGAPCSDLNQNSSRRGTSI